MTRNGTNERSNGFWEIIVNADRIFRCIFLSLKYNVNLRELKETYIQNNCPKAEVSLVIVELFCFRLYWKEWFTYHSYIVKAVFVLYLTDLIILGV